MAELEQALRREQDRSRLLESDLSRLRQQYQWASGSSGGSTPRRASPARLGSVEADSGGAGSGASGGDTPSPFAAAADAPPAANSSSAGAPPAAPLALPPGFSLSPAGSLGAGGGGGANDTVVVSRSALELLFLKERAMDAAKVRGWHCTAALHAGACSQCAGRVVEPPLWAQQHACN